MNVKCLSMTNTLAYLPGLKSFVRLAGDTRKGFFMIRNFLPTPTTSVQMKQKQI